MIKARYTVVLKTLLDDPEMKSRIIDAMSTYPLYEKKTHGEYIDTHIPTREELNTKILNYYKYKEIGFASPERFADELEIALNEIMPYYNQLLFTVDQDYEFMYNVDYTREFDITKDGTSDTLGTLKSKGTASTEQDATEKGTITSDSKTSETSETSAKSESDNKNVNVDTPQGLIDVGSSSIHNIDHASSVTFNSSNGEDSGITKGSGTSESTNTSDRENKTLFSGTNEQDDATTQKITSKDIEKHLERIKGNYGQMSFQSLIAKYRELIINIEQQIIHDERIRELFMSVL